MLGLYIAIGIFIVLEVYLVADACNLRLPYNRDKVN
jgi:hypothetical protein